MNNYFKELDIVELLVDKLRYNEHGVFAGMRGTIMDSRKLSDNWLVSFDEGEKIITISAHEQDLKLIYSGTFKNPISKHSFVELVTDKEEYVSQGISNRTAGFVLDEITENGKWKCIFFPKGSKSESIDDFKIIFVNDEDLRFDKQFDVSEEEEKHLGDKELWWSAFTDHVK